MTVRDVVLAVRQRWLALAICIFLGGGMGAGIALIGPAEYNSATRVVVAVPDIDQGSLQPPGGLSVAQRTTNYANLATSASVLQGVIDDLDLHATVKDLTRRVQVDMPTGTTVVQITATDDSPKGAQAIAQAVAEHLAAKAGTLEKALGVSDPQVVISVADAAPLPAQPNARGTALKGALGVLVGLIVGAGVVWVAEYLDSSVRDPEELAVQTGSAVIAVVPAQRATSLPMRGPAAAAFRTARAALTATCSREHGGSADGPSELAAAVYSVVPVAGAAADRSAAARAAIQLAVSEQRAGRRVVLVDADLQHAGSGDLLGMTRGAGLRELLTTADTAAPAVTPWAPGGIDVLTAGAAPDPSADVLRPELVSAILARLTETYETVVIAGPSALDSVDGATLASASVATVLVARWGSTRLEQVRHAKDRVTLSGGRLAGTLVDGAPGYRLGRDADFVPAPPR